MTFQGNVGFDLNFRCNLDININVSCFRIDKANTINHVLLVDTAVHHFFRSSKCHTVVYSKTFIKILESIGPNLLTCVTENTNHVSNIVLTLGIVGVDVFKSFKKTFIVKYISSCIDFLDLFFKVCGIFLLNNTKNLSIIVTDDTTISKRISCFSGQDRRHIFVINMEIQEVFQAFTCNQRSISSDNQCVACTILENRLCHHDSMPSS